MKKAYTPIAILLMAFSYCATATTTFHTEKWVTPNGVHVVFYPANEVPMLDISIAFAAGSAYDQKLFGLSALTANMINQGSAGLDATAIADSLADNGTQFSVEESRDMVVFNLRTLTTPQALAQSNKTFAHMLSSPNFADEAFDREKKQLLMSIKQAQESPDDVANLHFFSTLYQQHPYAHPVSGTNQTVTNIQLKQVKDFYHQYYVARNATMVLVGAIDSPTAHSIAEQITKGLATGQPVDALPKAAPMGKEETMKIPFPSSQTMVRFGQVGIDHHNPQYFPLVVGNYILGGGSLVSRLAHEVREKRGLTYGVDSQFIPMPGEGPFLISLSTKNAEAINAIALTKEVLQHFIKEGPNQQELQSAKQYLTGSFPLSLASNKTIATLLLRMAFYHLPDNYLTTYVDNINAVTINQIKNAFKKQVHPDAFLLITVGQS